MDTPARHAANAVSACPICGAAAALRHGGMYDDRYGYRGLFEVRRCATCGHCHTGAQFDSAGLSDLYTRYYPRAAFQVDQYRVPSESHGIGGWWSGERSAAFRWIPRGVRVLDIGCGVCETLGYHQSRGCEVYGVEADENVRRIAEQYGFDVRVGLFDADAYPREFFDYVTLDQVIEHMVDPLTVMRGVAKALKPGGVAVVSTPNSGGWGARVFGRKWINWHVPYHLQHFTRRSMALLAAKAGLSVTGARTLTHSDWMFFQFAHLLGVPDPGGRHPFWSGEKWRTPRQDRIFLAIARMRRLGLFQAATRLLDALGLGDNLVFFLQKPPADAGAG